MFARKTFSIRYKFLIALLGILLSALSVFFYFAYQTFSQDKTLFITDLNLTVMRSVTNGIKADFQRRIYEVQLLIGTLHEQMTQGGSANFSYVNPFQMLSSEIREEILALTYYREDRFKGWVRFRDFTNYQTLREKDIPAFLLYEINAKRPITKGLVDPETQIGWMNRSVRVEKNNQSHDVGVLTILLKARMVGGLGGNFLVAVDLSQDFLRKKLQESDIAEMFILKKDGSLISHRKLETILEFSEKPFRHPILSKLQEKENLPLESLQLKNGNEEYVVSYSQTGFKDLFVVSQVSRDAAFGALRLLIKNFVILALLIVCLALLITVFLAGRLTSNIQKMKEAAEQIGLGNLNVSLNIKTNDEIQAVSESMNTMVEKISVLLKESAERARMKGELETAQWVQSTLLTSPHISSDLVEVESYYSPATECGGDFFDASLYGNRLSVLIGDATGHGAPAALLTAVVKSFSSTIELLMKTKIRQDSLTVEDILSLLNSVIFRACGGRLLMTMAYVELNVDTGEILVCNAGHESPLRLINNNVVPMEQRKRKSISLNGFCDALFARGERLGHDPKSKYESKKYQLGPGDVILLYTDGIPETVNSDGKEWGSRNLKKTFVLSGLKSLSEIKLDLSEAVTRHRNTGEQDDDVTFVLVKWKGVVAAGQTVEENEAGEVDPHLEIVQELPADAASQTLEENEKKESQPEIAPALPMSATG